MNTEKSSLEAESRPSCLGVVSGSFSRLNDWFDMNADPCYFGKQLKENLYNEVEAKRLCIKLAKELIDSVRQNDFHFKNMSTVEVLEYLLK